jgi:ADP-ribosyl-[dinitrogen reductase] hydrolase
MINPKRNAIVGCLLGTAVGDAMGLPYEGLSNRRLNRIYPQIRGYDFCFGKGMVSDDTEHTCMVAQSLIISGGNVPKFQTQLAWKLRFWLLGLPAGVGWATLRACVKLWLGFRGDRAGVFSAGNGPAMRSAIIGVCYGHDLPKLRGLVQASTRLTHTDPKAEYGALAVAIAAYLSSQQSLISPKQYYQTLETILPVNAAEFLDLIYQACESAAKQETAAEFAEKLGLNKGITGYIYHTVTVVIQVWLQYHQDYQTAITEIIRLGGDTDTTAAILGGIIGAGLGKNGIPKSWLKNLWEWPRTVQWIEALGERLALCDEGVKQPALSLSIFALLFRNVFFLIVVLLHGFRRLLPPTG